MTNSRSKGSRNERSVAHIMQDWSGYEFARTPQSGGLHWKKQHTSGDIVCIDEKHGRRFPFSIECKFHEELLLLPLIQGLVGKKSNKIINFWEQSVEDANKVNKIPLVFMRKNGMKKDLHFIMMSDIMFNTWLSLLEKTPIMGWDSELGYLSYTWLDHRLIIVNSEDLMKTEYLAFYKAGRKLRKQYVTTRN